MGGRCTQVSLYIYFIGLSLDQGSSNQTTLEEVKEYEDVHFTYGRLEDEDCHGAGRKFVLQSNSVITNNFFGHIGHFSTQITRL